jgi:glycosyltransferase involved in cell wall biosynthesis
VSCGMYSGLLGIFPAHCADFQKRIKSPVMTKRRLKVVFVLPALEAGGAERVMISLANGLDRAEFDPAFVVVQNKGHLRGVLFPDIPVVFLRGVGVATSFFQLKSALEQLRPDIVVSTMAHMNFAVLLVRRFFPKVKFIVREAITPSFFLKPRSAAQAGLIRFLYRFLYPLADLIVSPAQCVFSELQSIIGPRWDIQRTALLPNPVDENLIRAQDIQRKTDTRVEYVCSGRLHPQKGFDRLIEALAGFQKPEGWHLTILGEGPERERLEDLIRQSNLQDHVTLAGHRLDPWGDVAGADAFLLPSRWEGLPNVVLESLACGTPVIAMGEAGGVGEIAAVANPGDVVVTQSMADFIKTMENVKAGPEKCDQRPSLLPDMFRKEAVLQQFSALLRGVI